MPFTSALARSRLVLEDVDEDNNVAHSFEGRVCCCPQPVPHLCPHCQKPTSGTSAWSSTTASARKSGKAGWRQEPKGQGAERVGRHLHERIALPQTPKILVLMLLRWIAQDLLAGCRGEIGIDHAPDPWRIGVEGHAKTR